MPPLSYIGIYDVVYYNLVNKTERQNGSDHISSLLPKKRLQIFLFFKLITFKSESFYKS